MFKYEWVWNKKLAGNGILAKIQPLKIHENILVFCDGKAPYMPQMTKGVYRKKLTNSLRVSEINNGDGIKIVSEIQNDDYYPKTILDYSLAGLRNGRIHPTQKPVALFEYLIRTYTNDGDTVLDNCAGSGTTGVACLNTNRRYILIEKEQKYYDICKERICKAMSNGI